MATNSKIEWCKHTWNPWYGCTAVSPACDHCYAEGMMATRLGRVAWGAGEDRKKTGPANWKEPFKWDKAAAAAGEIDPVFCLSLGDIWDNEVDQVWRDQALGVMHATPNLLYLLLSKRIGNAARMTDPEQGCRTLPPNAALGATMVNQAEWDRDMPKLREMGDRLGARFVFTSIEPMLGQIDMRWNFPDWVIVGGESGRGARPMHPDWVRTIRDQCAEADVPFFFKQWGDWLPWEPEQAPFWRSQNGQYVDGHVLFPGDMDSDPNWDDGLTYLTDQEGHSAFQRVGKKASGRMLDGALHDARPAFGRAA